MSRRFHSGAVAVLALALSLGLLELAEQPRELSPPTPTFQPAVGNPEEIEDCDRFASPSGSDYGRRRGGLRHPYRSVPPLLRSLRAGQTGCLEPGTYWHGGLARLNRRGTTLPGVGPRLAPLFEKAVQGTHVADLLWHLPNGLIDRR